MALIKFLAIVFLVVVAFRLLARIFLPLLGKYALNKVTKNMNEKMQSQSSGPKVYEDGGVVIRKTSGAKKSSNSQDDEYIDFQEID